MTPNIAPPLVFRKLKHNPIMTRLELENRILDIVAAAPLVPRSDVQGMVEALVAQVIKQ